MAFNLEALGLTPDLLAADPQEQLRKRMIPALRPQPEIFSGIGRPTVPAIGAAANPPTAPEIGVPSAPAGAPPTLSPARQPESPAIAQARQTLDAPKPEYHGWKRFLDTLGGATTIGQSIEAASGMGTIGDAVKRARAQGVLNQEQKRKAGEAQIEDVRSQSHLRDAQAHAAENKDDTTLAKVGLHRDENGNIVPIPDEQLGPELKTKMANEKNLAELRDSQRRLAEAKAEVERAKGDPNSPQFKIAQQKLQMEQQRTNATLRALGLHEAEFANKLNEQELVKPSGQTQSRGSAAQAAIAMIPELKQQAGALRNQLGPLAGRISKWEGVIGDVPPEVARFYANLKQYYSLLGAAHGWRAIETPREFEKAMGGLERNPDALIAALEGSQSGMQKIVTEGKTSHRRIVEGKTPDTAPTVRYTEGTDTWDIPPEKEEKFKKAHPNAKRQ